MNESQYRVLNTLNREIREKLEKLNRDSRRLIDCVSILNSSEIFVEYSYF